MVKELLWNHSLWQKIDRGKLPRYQLYHHPACWRFDESKCCQSYVRFSHRFSSLLIILILYEQICWLCLHLLPDASRPPLRTFACQKNLAGMYPLPPAYYNRHEYTHLAFFKFVVILSAVLLAARYIYQFPQLSDLIKASYPQMHLCALLLTYESHHMIG